MVAVIGKSQLNFHHSKATMINQMLLSDAFSVKPKLSIVFFHCSFYPRKLSSICGGNMPLIFLKGNIPDKGSRCTVEKPSVIEGYYDSDQHVIYLHLQSEYDACQMSQLCQKAAQHISSVVRVSKCI